MNKWLLCNVVWVLIAVGAYFAGTRQSSTVAGGPGESARVAAAPGLAGKGTGLAGQPARGGSKSGVPGAHLNGSDLLSGDMSVQELVALAKSETNPIRRARAFTKLLESLTADNAVEIVEAMREAGVRSEEQWGLVLYAWGSIDGAGAMGWGSGNLEDDQRREFLGRALTGWASADPAAAKSWVEGLDDEREQGRFRWSLVNGMADADIGIATSYAMERQEAGDRHSWRFMEMITEKQLGRSDLEESVRWAESLPDGDIKISALHRVATDFTQSDPVAAAKWAEGISGDDAAVKVVHEVSDEWAESDPRAALDWLNTLEAGEARTAGMSAALAEWVKRGDPMEASKYLAELPGSPERDSAVGGFARVLARSDPQSAVQWAETIEEPEIRAKTLVETGRMWMHRDATAASAWLEGGSVSVELAEKITARPEGDYDEGEVHFMRGAKLKGR